MEQYWYNLNAQAALEYDEWLSRQSGHSTARSTQNTLSARPSVPPHFSDLQERSPSIRTPADFSFRSSTPQPTLNITRTDNSLPRPLLPNHDGEFVPQKITVGEALGLLDKVFSKRQPIASRRGWLSQCLAEADPEEEIDPLLCVAIFSARTVRGQDDFTERSVAELGMLGQALTNFLYNPAKIVAVNVERNGFPRPNTYHHVKKILKRAVDSLVDSGLIQSTDTVIDVGSGYGCVTKYLIEKGIDTTALEPLFLKVYFQGILDAKFSQGKIASESKLEQLSKIITMTAEEYVRNNPTNKYSVVIACNFRPNTSGRSMTEALAALTKADGKALIGISCVDPQDVAATPYNMKPYLEEYFDNVRYIPARDISVSEFNEYFSVGGQMGFYECKSPRTQQANLADCTPM